LYWFFGGGGGGCGGGGAAADDDNDLTFKDLEDAKGFLASSDFLNSSGHKFWIFEINRNSLANEQIKTLCSCSGFLWMLLQHMQPDEDELISFPLCALHSGLLQQEVETSMVGLPSYPINFVAKSNAVLPATNYRQFNIRVES